MSFDLKGALKLRPVTLDDSRILLAWRNDPDTRYASRNSEPVECAQHEAWLAEALTSPERVLRIVEIAGRPVGIVRADRTDQGWELSWTVAPEAREHGIGRRMVCAFAGGLEGCVTATIRRGHAASEKIAAAARLRRSGLSDHRGFDHWMRS